MTEKSQSLQRQVILSDFLVAKNIRGILLSLNPFNVRSFFQMVQWGTRVQHKVM